ncbi:DUF6631 family protein [Pseudomonas sp. M30-35]|uniref:DUF6631 family protein n=1 Tax=Pseudomonas sp. M30-35 TaxID=1981174 RepID=UPI000B3C0988|nr:DUF6631 family protein [Pseudomonas sp. M30-35]ARU87121.1 hypothetical protein B9K09_03590 [Pseudomonas sp. M30-35]
MARRKRGVIKASEPAAVEGADDLQVLHPNLAADLNGRQVMVREYGFVEGLQLQAELQPFLNGLYELAQAGTTPSLDEILVLIGRHTDIVMGAMAISADVTVDELKGLKSQIEGRTLLMKWWTANGPFFWRCVHDRILGERELAKRRGGQISTPSSSAPATETSNPSGE